MPTYVYKDLETGETFEVIQSMTDTALKQNPETGAPVKRIIQPVGIAFKGSGFYVTDSRKKTSSDTSDTKDSKKTEGQKVEGSSKEAKESNSSTKTDSKTDSKADNKNKAKVKKANK